MTRLMRMCLFLLLATHFTPMSFAETPEHGTLANISEPSSLSFSCQMDGQLLNCDFAQVIVVRKADPKKIDAEIKKANDDYARMTTKDFLDKKTCDGIADFENHFENGDLPKEKAMSAYGGKAFASMTVIEKADTKSFSDKYLNFCKNPTKENFIDLASFTFSINSRTCSITTNTFKQIFKQDQL